LEVRPLGFLWDTADPFLFCAYHKDSFPNGKLDGTIEQHHLRGRNIGSDFQVKDGFRMYHAERAPGFPRHPHRGFETITIIREGKVDHHDSLGAQARFGGGGSDTQWVTTGNGIQHSEMFPLIHSDKGNPMTLFQIWLNLDSKHKFAKPYFTMLWSEKNPVVKSEDGKVNITVIADEAQKIAKAQASPPDSWASQEGSDVGIFLIDMEKDGSWTLPAAQSKETQRKLFYYAGDQITINGKGVKSMNGIKVDSSEDLTLKNGPNEEARILVLQGRPIKEPVAQHGPFVLNTQQELQQAFTDYRRTQFGGWPWERDDEFLPTDHPRFARHPDGRTEYPDQSE